MVTVSATVPRELTYEIQRVSGFRNRHLRRLVVTGDGKSGFGAVRVVARVPAARRSRRDDGVELAAFPRAANRMRRRWPVEFRVTRTRSPAASCGPSPPRATATVLVPAHPTQLRID